MVHKMYVHTWFLLFAGVWVVVACTPTPETVVTVVADRPTDIATPSLNTSDTPPPSNSPTTTPLLISQSPTAIPTPISTQDVAATYTAIHATSEAEAATLFAPTPTFTPSPTFTPVPGPILRIFFRAIACPEWENTCNDSLAMSSTFAGYLINSDGSQLTPITDLGFPADLSHPVFSPDGTKLAYLAALGGGLPHLFLANSDGSEAIDLGVDDFLDFQFTHEENCLIVARRVAQAAEGLNLMIEKRCINEVQFELLDSVVFPVFYEIHFSPNGDAILAYGLDSSRTAQLVVHQIGGNSQTLFSQSDNYFTGVARWLPDGWELEFISTGHLTSNNTMTTTFNLIERDGNDLQNRLITVASFGISHGVWSPDGQQFAFTYGHDSVLPEESGLYVLDFTIGEWRQILSHFYLSLPPQIDIWLSSDDQITKEE